MGCGCFDSNYENNPERLNQMVARILDKINKDIVSKYPGAGTTLCFSLVMQNSLYMCNIGDSKGFVMKNGHIIYETKTHNVTDCLLHIPDDFGRFHVRSNVISHYLGNDAQDVKSCIFSDIIPMDKNNDYHVVLCSDGLSDCLSNDQIMDTVNRSSSEHVARDLVSRALNSRSSFQQELENSRRKYGIMGKFNFNKLVKVLRENGMDKDYEKIIMGGKDNTTVVSGVVRR